MKKLWLLIAGLAVIAVVGLAGCNPGTTIGGTPPEVKVNLNSQQEGIWVSGTGKVSAVPDIATLGLGVEAQAATAGEARSQASEAMDAVMKALADNGVDKKDIQTQYFSIQRVTRWDDKGQQEIVIGYRVTNTVTAKIRALDKAGTIIDAVAVAGGDLTRINSIGFTVEDPSAYQDKAREKAIADAKEKATQMAELAGVKLGKPTYITESTYFPSPIFRQDLIEKGAAAPAVETPISAGELEISANVQLVYTILN